MTKKQIANCKTIAELRSLYTKNYPKNPVYKMEAWINKIINYRRTKNANL